MKKILLVVTMLHIMLSAQEMVKNRILADPAYGTHMCALITAVAHTDGPILEMGCGDYSTPLLHALCTPHKRLLVSSEGDQKWLSLFLDLENSWHKFYYIPRYEWDRIGEGVHWSVVFIDHRPGERRIVDIQRLRKNTDIFVVHDTEDAYYNYEPTFASFNYRYDYERYATKTTLISDTVDVRQFFN